MAGEVSGSLYVVQFPHPGTEHNPGDAQWMAWNTRPHARKFLRSFGRFQDRDGLLREGDLVFWGEWEPPSRVIQRWPRAGRLPRFLHQPVWGEPDLPVPRQNTDPWVFGNAFLYSNCKQLTPHGTPSALQSLNRGSVILFGSQVDGDFVLDTLLVVADAIPYVPTRASHLNVDDAFRVCTVESLSIPGSKDHRNAPFTLHRGATVDEPIEAMFSFVPARPANGAAIRFARPSIILPGYINPDSKQSPSGARRPRTLEEVRQVWRSVRDQVIEAGCVLGVSFPTPPRDDDTALVPTAGRGRC